MLTDICILYEQMSAKQIYLLIYTLAIRVCVYQYSVEDNVLGKQ